MLRLRDEQWSKLDKMLPENLRKLPEDWGKIDQLLEELLEDAQILELFHKKHPSQMGRPTYPIEKYLRLMYVKSHYDLGYESLVKEVGDSFTLRRFCRISIDEPMPNSTTLLKIGQRYGEELTKELNQRLVKKLADQRIIKHRKMRTDTTVTESNIHHPTDATLLQDGVRVITRMMSKVRKVASHAAEGFEDMTNEVKKTFYRL
jgi:transposase, IS5 family